MIRLTESNFEAEVLSNELPVLVDFFAEWCAPCKQLKPLLQTLAEELSGKLVVGEVDTDASPMLAQALRVQSLPTLVLFRGGQPVAQQAGVLTLKALRDFVQPALPRDAAELVPTELAQMISQGMAVAVDIRDANSFGRYRIPGALNMPSDQLVVTELAPVDGRLRVLYGRGADEARSCAEDARKQGLEVAFLAGGFLHWEADGLPVERA